MKNKRRHIFIKVDETRLNPYSDQTGKFPCRSSRGNKYFLIGFDLQANYSKFIPIKNVTEKELI